MEIPSLSSDDIDNIILQLKSVPAERSGVLPEPTIRALCALSREIFINEPMLLELTAPINICGK